MKQKLTDANVLLYKPLMSPRELKERFPISGLAEETVLAGRESIKRILDRQDERKILIVGPCSIHDPEEALEYAVRLKGLSDQVQDIFLVVMRAYFEKPRTTIGWKGLVYDPHLDSTHDIQYGLSLARRLLVNMAELRLPCATEFLGTLTPQYLDDLVSYAGIGARTTESQSHREMASGLSMPVGFKNSTYGEVEVAINAIKSAQNGHAFIGQDVNGRVSIVETKGNPYCHVILRGGNGKPNYDPQLVSSAIQSLRAAGLHENIIIDCSHGNSEKKHEEQPRVFGIVVDQICEGNQGIVGAMLESYIHAGAQKIEDRKAGLKAGLSVTDACISWETTEEIILSAYRRMKG